MASLNRAGIRRHSYIVILVGTALVALGILALVLCGVVGTGKGTFLAVLAATTATVLLFNETREDRLTARRPFVLVDFEDPSEERQGETVRYDRSSAYLNIRNRGLGVATDIHLSFSEPIRDGGGKDIMENPLLRQGIRFLAPGRVMTLKVAHDTWYSLYLKAQPHFRAGEAPPPQFSPTITVTATYRDGITQREYEETFTIDVATHVHNWTITKE